MGIFPKQGGGEGGSGTFPRLRDPGDDDRVVEGFPVKGEDGGAQPHSIAFEGVLVISQKLFWMMKIAHKIRCQRKFWL